MPSMPADSICIKDNDDIDIMKGTCRLVKNLLDLCQDWVKPGISTKEIDKRAFQFIMDNQAYPSPLGYMGFPASICTSVNNVMVHGIPDDQPLQDGDIVNVDVTIFKDGFHGDASRTYLVGNQVDDQAKSLVNATKAALDLAISECAVGVPIHRIGHVIQDYARSKGFAVNHDFCGHGIGMFLLHSVQSL